MSKQSVLTGLILSSVFAALVGTGFPPHSNNTAQAGTISQGAIQVDLKTQLEKGLQVRRPQEFAFIARVVTLVVEGKLPLSTVNKTFQWARSKRPYPFVYFERAIRVQAARLGITI